MSSAKWRPSCLGLNELSYAAGCSGRYEYWQALIKLTLNWLKQKVLSCNNGDYEFTKAVCNYVNLSFEIRSDHLKGVNQII